MLIISVRDNENNRWMMSRNYMNQSIFWWSVDVYKYETCYPFWYVPQS